MYECKNCVHSTTGSSLKHRNKNCKKCVVDSSDLSSKPSEFKERNMKKHE